MLLETSLIVQWLRLHIPNSVHMGSIPDQGTKILHAVIKTNERGEWKSWLETKYSES